MPLGARRRRWYFVLAAVVCLLAAGCSVGRAKSTDALPPDQVTGTLRVLTPSYPSTPDGQKAFAKVVADFHKTYPKMTVAPDYTTYKNLNEKIATSIASGSGYDVVVMGVGWVPPFAAKKIFEPLSTFGFTPAEYDAKYVPALRSASSWNGQLYAVPITADARAIGYRVSAFERAGLDPDHPPTTLAGIQAAAQKLTVRNAKGEITKQGFDFNAAAGSYRQDFIFLAASFGQSLYNGDEPGFDNANGVRTLQWMKDQQNSVSVFGLQNAAQKPMVWTGQAAMGFVGGQVDCSSKGIGQANCNDLRFFLPNNGKPAEFVGGNLASVGATSLHKKAAWSFIQALTTTQAVDDQALLNSQIPATKDTLSTSASRSNPLSLYVAKNLQYATFEGGPVDWLDVRNSFNYLVDDALLGKRSPSSVLDRLAQQTK